LSQIFQFTKWVKTGTACKVILLNYKKDGTKFWNELSISPIEENGKVVGFVGIQDDITTRIKVEKALIKAKQDAEIANNSKADFLNVISHELRTPLTVMLGNIPLLTDSSDMPAKEEIAEIAVDIEEAGIVNCVQSALNLIQPLITNKGLQLIKNMEDFNFIGDPIRMKQIIINLLGNASKFTDEGSVTITTKKDENFGQLIISDTGCGIKEEYLTKIFDVFKQVDSSTTRVTSGSGLGLAISKKLIELQDGIIQVKSEYGVGSDFYISIPILR